MPTGFEPGSPRCELNNKPTEPNDHKRVVPHDLIPSPGPAAAHQRCAGKKTHYHFETSTYLMNWGDKKYCALSNTSPFRDILPKTLCTMHEDIYRPCIVHTGKDNTRCRSPVKSSSVCGQKQMQENYGRNAPPMTETPANIQTCGPPLCFPRPFCVHTQNSHGYGKNMVLCRRNFKIDFEPIKWFRNFAPLIYVVAVFWKLFSSS